ncbi:hypothetical protein GQ54DRAFT_337771 [Martensiomyces pterosporus]|nr:hypothetical protein GQ54DRAFT_337771 [Martensiomyces pterosporus]
MAQSTRSLTSESSQMSGLRHSTLGLQRGAGSQDVAVSALKPLPTRNKSVWKQSTGLRWQQEQQQPPPRVGRSETWKEYVAEWEKHLEKRRQVTGEAIFQIPYPRQFISDGILHQFPIGSNMDSLDLFWDLVFVGAIQRTAHILLVDSTSSSQDTANEPADSTYMVTGTSVGYFCIMFSVMSKIWVAMDHWSQVFGTNDLVHRLLVVWQMCLVLAMGSELSNLFQVSNNVFIGCYVALRLTMAINYALYFIYLPLFRGDLGFIVVMHLVPALLWLSSIWVPFSSQWAVWATAALIEIFEPLILWAVVRVSRHLGLPWRHHLALNVSRTAKRYGEFIMLTLGEFVLGSFYHGTGELNSKLGRAVIGMLIVASIHWIYFHCEASHQSQHALLRSHTSSFLWTLIHRPLAAALIIGCFSLSNVASLEVDEHVPDGLAWLFTVGIGGAIIHLSLLGWTHRSLDDIHYTRVSKPVRLTVRAITGAVIIVLPVANDHLQRNILLPAIVMAICLALLLFEMVGRVVVQHPPQDDTELYPVSGGGTARERQESREMQNEFDQRRSHSNEDAYASSANGTDTESLGLAANSEWIDNRERWGASYMNQIAPSCPAPVPTENAAAEARATPGLRGTIFAVRAGVRLSRSRAMREYNLRDIPGSVPMS